MSVASEFRGGAADEAPAHNDEDDEDRVRDAHAMHDARARHDTHATPRIVGTLHVSAWVRGERTVIDVLRQDGLARCSRPLYDPSQPGAVRLVVAQLGPGFVRGDRFETRGELGPRADLVVAAQSATRILGRGAPSVAHARWSVAQGARLFIRGEPSIPHDGASHIAETRVDLAHGASLTWLDALAPHGAFGTIATSLNVFADARLAIYDRSTYHSGNLRTAVVTGFYVRAGISAEDTAHLVALADAHAAGTREGISIGVGSPACGGVMLRATGPSVRDALDTVATLVSIVRRRDIDRGPGALRQAPGDEGGCVTIGAMRSVNDRTPSPP